MGFFDKIVGKIVVGAEPPKPARPAADAPPHIDKTGGDSAARRMRLQLEQGNFAEAQQMLEGNHDWDDRFFFVDRFADWKGRPAWLDAWCVASPSSPIPWLVRGAHGVKWGWEARGGGKGEDVTKAGWVGFEQRLRGAVEDLDRAAQLDPKDPTPWAIRIICSIGLGEGADEQAMNFAQAVVNHPEHRAAHNWRLMGLLEKWGGSHDASLGFARQASAKAPPGSAVHGVLASAIIERFMFPWSFEENKDAAFAWLANDSVKREIHEARRKRFTAPPAVRRDRWLIPDHNQFAFLYWMMEDAARAREEFDAIGSRVEEAPWQWMGEPVKTFIRAKGWAAKK